jgi:hypothetical protein
VRYCLVTIFVCVSSMAQSADGGFANWRERWDNYVERTYDWKLMTAVAAESAIDQSLQLSKCWRPPYCVPHHIGHALIRRTTRNTLELAAGELLGEDIRRRPSGLTGLRRRAVFALLHAPLARDSNGDWRPAYSRFAGTLSAVVVSRAWDGRPITAGSLAQSFGWTASSYFQDALFTEFEPDLRRLGRNAWRNHVRPVFRGKLTTP